jgi:hypothetical protein
MAFKMKNPSIAKLTKAAGNNRVAMKMKMESAAKMKKEAAMKMKQEAAMKMEKDSPAKQKMNMVKGPDGNMVPDFAVDGKGANDMKSATKLKKFEQAEGPAKGKTKKEIRQDRREDRQERREDRKMARKLKKGLKARGKEMEGKPRGTGMIFNEQVEEDLKKFSKVGAPTKLKKGDIEKDLKGGKEMLAAKKNPGKYKKAGGSIYEERYLGTGENKSTKKAERKFAKAEKKLAKGNLKAAARKVKKGRKTVISMPSGRYQQRIQEKYKDDPRYQD